MNLVSCLIFSKDRAFQLEAVISSFFRHLNGNIIPNIDIIYKTSDAKNQSQYEFLRDEYSKKYPINFIEETNFYDQTLKIIKENKYILFLVDDNIFVNSFSINKYLKILEKHNEVIGVSQRLGLNTTYCYSLNSPQKIPKHSYLNDFIIFDWTEAEYDFNYPLEVSSSIYRSNDLLNILTINKFKNPNTLESVLSNNKNSFSSSKPYLVSHTKSVTFCNPVNIVQNVYITNRRGNNNKFSAENNQLYFSENKVMDISKFDGFTPNSCHQEVEYEIIPRVQSNHFSISQIETLPKFSLIMANYNGGKYIKQAIESVLNQTFKDWELIIIDDYSNDNSIEIIYSFLYDKRIKLIKHEFNKKYISSLITGINNINSPYFGTLDSDDALANNAIEVMYQAHINYPDASYIYSQFYYCDENLNPVKIGYCAAIPQDRTNLDSDKVSHFRTFKKSFYDKTKGYETDILHAEDKDISYKMEEVGSLLFVNEILYYYRVLPNSISHIPANRQLSLETMLKAKVNAIQRRKILAFNSNKYALELFKNAENFILNEKFSEADKNIQEYKKLIRYETFPRHDKRNQVNPKVSIIIVAYDTNHDLIHCINSIFNQLQNVAELIVIDNGKNELVCRQLLSLPLLYICTPMNLLPSEGRNIGVNYAKGEIVTFLDDDSIAETNWVQNIINNFSKYDIKALRGKIIPKNPAAHSSTSKHYNLGEIHIPHYIGTEGNSAYYRSVYKEFSGHNPLLFGAEGAEFSYRIYSKYGINSIIYSPDVIIYHDYAITENKLDKKLNRHDLMRKYITSKYSDFPNYLNYLNFALSSTENIQYANLRIKLKVNNDILKNLLIEKEWTNKFELYNRFFDYSKFVKKVENPTISIIIISWKYKSEILQNIKLLNSSINTNLEIIFVNNGADDIKFENLLPYINFYVKLNTNTGAYLARNIGAAFATAPILLFLDDDGIPDKNLVNSHIHAFKKYNISICRGKILPKTLGSEKPAHYDLGNKILPIFPDVEGNTSFKSSLFFAVGGWDDQIQFGGGGVDISIRIYKLSSDFNQQIYIPDAILYHDFTKNDTDNSTKKQLQDISRNRLKSIHPYWDKYINEYFNYSQSNNFRISLLPQNPFISICIPTYNRAEYLKDAIQSALTQNYDNYEIIIVDDGSTDNTKAIIDNFDSKIIKYFYQENAGRPFARNRLISEAKGDYILWLDSDDVLDINILSEYTKIILDNNPDIIYCDIEVRDKNLSSALSKVVAPDYTENSNNLLRNIIKGVGITFGGSLMKKETLIKVGLFDTDFLRAQDNELWSRLASIAKFYKSNKILYYYRKHDSNISLTDVIDTSYESMVLKKILKSNPLDLIYNHKLSNTIISDNEIMTEIAEGFFHFEDYFSTIEILKNNKGTLNSKSLILLIKSLIAIGDYKSANYLLDTYKNLLQDSQYRIFADSLSKIQSLNNKTINSNNLGQINSTIHELIQNLQFIPAVVYYIKAIYLSDNYEIDNALKYFKKALIASPKNELIYNNLLNFAKKINKETEVITLKNRISKPIYFFKSNSTSELNTSLISVIIPTKNRLNLLREAIQSVLSQTYSNFEIIVINDGGESITKLLSDFNDNRIKHYEHTLSRGVAAARNTGLKNSSGEYICYLDDDDLYYKNHLEVLLNAAIDNPNFKFFYSKAYNHTIIEKQGNFETISKEIVYNFNYEKKLLLWKNLFPTLCVMHHSDLVVRCGYFDETLITHEDWEYWLRLSEITDFKFIDIITAEYRTFHDKNSLSKNKFSDFYDSMKFIYNKYSDGGDSNLALLRNQHLSELQYRINQIDNSKENISKISISSNVSIIIPVFNKSELTKNCIESIYKFTDINTFELIIVDNGSSDDTVNIIENFKNRYNNIVYIKNEVNLGYSKANNIGAKVAKFDFILLLNNDTIVTENWLPPLVYILVNDNQVAASGAKLLFANEKIQHAGVCIINDIPYNDPLVARHIYYGFDKNAKEVNIAKEYQALTGACLLVRKSAYFEVGGLDEEYWNAYEDVDLCFKLGELNYKLVYQPESIVYHLESQSGPERYKGVTNSIQRLHNKWLGKINVDFIIDSNNNISILNPVKIKNYILPNVTNTTLFYNTSKSINKLTSIILLAKNQYEYTKECIDSIYLYTKENFELILVDNGSDDNIPNYFRELQISKNNVKVLTNKENVGFPKGVNQALRVASGDYILIGNNDTVFTPDWLSPMITQLEKSNENGLIGPISNNISGPQIDKNANYSNMAEMLDYAAKVKNMNTGKFVQFPRVAFFCTLIKREVIEKIGALDEIFSPGNYEDDDYCMRAQIAGFKTFISYEVFIHHYRSRSFVDDGNSLYRKRLETNERKFIKKWGGTPDEIWIKGKLITPPDIYIPL